jgi:hypothetical protein
VACENQTRVDRFNTSKALFGSKLVEGAPVSPHVIKMIGYTESLQRLGFPLDDDLAIDVILQSLPTSFEPFIMNYHMNGLKKTLTELHGILKMAEVSLRKALGHVMTVQKGKKRKRLAKAKKPAESETSKQATKVKEKNKKASPSPDDVCFHCGVKGHWSRNCKKYLEEKKKNGGVTSTQGINVIEINLATRSNNAWVFDTGAMIHTCKSLQGLKIIRRFARDDVDLRVGNGAKVVALAVGNYSLSLPSGLVLELNNYYFVPALNKNIISASCLEDDGFEFVIKNKCCSIFMNGMYFGRCPVVNGLYVLNLEEN